MNDDMVLLTPAQVGDLLGVSIRTVERLVQIGRLPPPLKLGRASRWQREAIFAALAQQAADDAPARTAESK